jgi:hypothetical protein
MFAIRRQAHIGDQLQSVKVIGGDSAGLSGWHPGLLHGYVWIIIACRKNRLARDKASSQPVRIDLCADPWPVLTVSRPGERS